jgi:hypothetical protein
MYSIRNYNGLMKNQRQGQSYNKFQLIFAYIYSQKKVVV